MNTSRVFRCATACAFLLLGANRHVCAAPIAIDDSGFEVLNQGAGAWSNDLSQNNWTGRDGENSGNAFLENIDGFASDGDEHIGMVSDYYVFQDLGVPFEPNARYVLTVGVGNRNNAFTEEGNESWYGLTNELPASDGSQTMTDLAPALLAANFVDAESFTTDGAFADAPAVVFETGDSPPAGTMVVVVGGLGVNRSHFDNIRLVDELADDDGDGLPDCWEVENGLDPNDDGSLDAANGPDGDPDADGSTNLSEFDNSTDPQNGDTDGDGLADGVETGTGVFVNAGDTGSDPLVADTDGDTISDADEVNGVAGNATDPNRADSDGDGFQDPSENVAGTDPNNGADTPAITGPSMIGINFAGGRNARTNDPNGGYIQAGRIAMGAPEAGVVTQGGWNNFQLNTGAGVSAVDDSGTTISALVTWVAPNTWSIDGDINNVFSRPKDGNAALMQGYLDRDPVVEIVGVPYETYDVVLYFDSDSSGLRRAEYSLNGETKRGIVNLGTNWNIAAGAGSFQQGFSVSQAANYVVFHGVSDHDISLAVIGRAGRGTLQGLQLINATLDGDGGGVPDSTEARLSLDPNDGGVDDRGDPDGDGLTTADEIAAETDPFRSDTDGDGLADGTEQGGETDPLDPDSDADGLNDGREDALGTNPAVADTDGDGLNDGEEANALGTDPLDEDSDGDTLSDGDEVLVYGSDPLAQDSDGDTLLDRDEVNTHGTDPASADTDGDGIADNIELNLGTDPVLDDTDGDGLPDGFEVNERGSDPLDPNDPGGTAGNAIGINFVSDQEPNSALAPTEFAGHPAYLQNNWNNTSPMVAGAQSGSEFDIAGPTPFYLSDSSGQGLDDIGDGTGFPTTTAFWTAGGRGNAGNGLSGGAAKLMNGYLDAGALVAFTGIPYSVYDVVVYVGADVDGRDGTVVLTDDTTFAEIGRVGYSSSAAVGEFSSSDFIVSEDTDNPPYEPGNVVIFRDVSTPAVAVENVLPLADPMNTGIFAVQIVEQVAVGADLALRDISLSAPDTLRVTWEGGDGTSTIQTSSDGQAWSDAAAGVASPATITVDPGIDAVLLVRVVER